MTDPTIRRTGIGYVLMKQGLSFVAKEYGKKTPVRISAQKHLEKFYMQIGFQRTSQEYLEDNIPHIEMLFL